MNQTARIISIYAADTSGVCSALYEFGGMTVIHDASGCNSTYTTHDEPRWYEMDSMMYISGLTESDAVMGNDEKFISDLVTAAEELKPEYIAICASPMPAMIGIDMDAIAFEAESRTGIPAFDVKTNGMQSYITGAANAFLKLSERFTGESGRRGIDQGRNGADQGSRDVDHGSYGTIHGRCVNILGMTPLDFPLGTDEKIRKWLENEGFTVNACIGMGTSLEEVRRLGDADVSLVVASSGRSLAESLLKKYGIPFVTGVPYGKVFAEKLAEELRKLADRKRKQGGSSEADAEKQGGNGETDSGKQGGNGEADAEKKGGNGEADMIINAAARYRKYDKRIAVLGESILSTSLAAAISLETGFGVRVLETVGDGDMTQLISAEDSARASGDLKAEDSARASGDLKAEDSARASGDLKAEDARAIRDFIGDKSCDDEDELECELQASEIIIGDPLFKPICHGKKFVELPHDAFSGRCFKSIEMNLIGAENAFPELIERLR